MLPYEGSIFKCVFWVAIKTIYLGDINSILIDCKIRRQILDFLKKKKTAKTKTQSKIIGTVWTW